MILDLRMHLQRTVNTDFKVGNAIFTSRKLINKRGNVEEQHKSKILSFLKSYLFGVMASLLLLYGSASARVIDNDIPVGTIGHFSVDVRGGGQSGFSNSFDAEITADGQETSPITDLDLISDYFSYVDVGSGGFLISSSRDAASAGPDATTSSGSFTGSNGNIIDWTVTSSIPDLGLLMTSTFIFTARTDVLGNIRFYQYLDEDVIGLTNDIFFTLGTAASLDLQLFTVDNIEVFGVSHGGAYSKDQGLINAIFAGWAADKYRGIAFGMKPDIVAGTQSVSLTGVINNLPGFTHPIVGSAFGPADIVSVLAWDVDPNATTATIITTLGGVTEPPEPPKPPDCDITYYFDFDEDGYGDPAISMQACEAPQGYVEDNTDCDDNDAKEHPGQTWYKDADGDGYSDGTTDTTSCEGPIGYKVESELTATSGDCDDNDANEHPGQTWYKDTDNDGYFDGTINTTLCTRPTGYKVLGELATATTSIDCDDNNPDVNPGATEIIDNGIDDDCDPSTPYKDVELKQLRAPKSVGDRSGDKMITIVVKNNGVQGDIGDVVLYKEGAPVQNYNVLFGLEKGGRIKLEYVYSPVSGGGKTISWKAEVFVVGDNVPGNNTMNATTNVNNRK